MRDAVLFGRVTFEEMRGHWPADRRHHGVTDYLNQVAKYVVSSTLADPAGAHHRPAGARVPGRASLTTSPGRDIVTTGSITLVHALIAPGSSCSAATARPDPPGTNQSRVR